MEKFLDCGKRGRRRKHFQCIREWPTIALRERITQMVDAMEKRWDGVCVEVMLEKLFDSEILLRDSKVQTEENLSLSREKEREPK